MGMEYQTRGNVISLIIILFKLHGQTHTDHDHLPQIAIKTNLYHSSL